jgi:hypothetical protein
MPANVGLHPFRHLEYLNVGKYARFDLPFFFCSFLGVTKLSVGVRNMLIR